MDNSVLFLLVVVGVAFLVALIVFVFCTDAGEKYKKFVPTVVVFLMYVGGVAALVGFDIIPMFVGISLVLLGFGAAIELAKLEG